MNCVKLFLKNTHICRPYTHTHTPQNSEADSLCLCSQNISLFPSIHPFSLLTNIACWASHTFLPGAPWLSPDSSFSLCFAQNFLSFFHTAADISHGKERCWSFLLKSSEQCAIWREFRAVTSSLSGLLIRLVCVCNIQHKLEMIWLLKFWVTINSVLLI